MNRGEANEEKRKRTAYVVKLGRERSLSIQERQCAEKEAKLTVPERRREKGSPIHPRNARLLTNALPRTKIYAAKPPARFYSWTTKTGKQGDGER